MNVEVFPRAISGHVAAIPSKSAAHRALICAALAGGMVAPIAESADMQATLGVLKSIGFLYKRQGAAMVFPKCSNIHGGVCNCKESGSTLRFLLPVVAALGVTAEFTGEGRLPQRPLEPLQSLMKEHGVTFTADGLPFSIKGKLQAGEYHLPGDVSSQYISGLLFALPLLSGDSVITVTTPLQSAGYVDMTLNALEQSGVIIHPVPNGYQIPGNQVYQPQTRIVEGDWSGAAFWLCAGAIFGKITVTGLDCASAQGDQAVVALLRKMGARVESTEHEVTVFPSQLQGISVDAAPIPDLVPIMAVTAAYAKGVTEIYNAARLRIKESDRLTSVVALLRAIGGQVEEFPDRLRIHGGAPLQGGVVDGANDHRIVMSAAIAALGCQKSVTISHRQAVGKSYPDFFDVLKSLGGVCHGI